MFIKRKNDKVLKIAYIISRGLEPFWLFLLMGMVIIFSQYFAGYDSFAWGIGLLLFLGFLPVLAIWLGLKKGKVSDIDFSRKEERTPYIMTVLGFWLSGWILTWVLAGPKIISAVLLAAVVVGIVVLIINFYWKISNHALAITAVSLFINELYNWEYWWLIILIPVVSWARWVQKKHTWGQLIGGTVLGILFIGLVKLIGY